MLDLNRPIKLMDRSPDYFLDTFLKGICLKIQPLDSMIERFQKSYQIVEDILRNAPEGSIIHKIDLKVFVQGSILSNTVVKPIHKDELDLDVVILFKLDHKEVNPRAVQDEIYKLLKADGRYKDKVEKKSRCITIQYKTAFHIDLMPALPEFLDFEDDWILVPHKLSEGLYDWQSSNPIGINKWLTGIEERFRMDSLDEIKLSNASIEVEPFPQPTKYKSNIRYIIQLLKRARDHHFKEDEDCKKIARSIALLVLTGTHYRPVGGSIIAELRFVVEQIIEATSDFTNLHVYNPLHLDREPKDREDFAEKWRQNPEVYLKFRAWTKSLKDDLDELYEMRGESYSKYVNKLKKLFNEGPVDNLLNEYADNRRKMQNAGKLGVSGATGAILGSSNSNASTPIPKAKSFGGKAREFFPCESCENKLPFFAQVEKMRRDFPNFKSTFLKEQRRTIRWIGEVQPEVFGDKYKISITFKDGHHPVVRVLSHDVSGSKHLYPENRLCLYHPYKGENRWQQNETISSKIVPLTIMWLIQSEVYRNTGKWNGDEFPHGNPSQLERAV